MSIVPSVSSSTPTPTFDFLNVPGDNATIEEAYSWIKEGGTIMVAPGTHLVSLSIQRHVHIVSAGGAESTILRPRWSNMFSASAPCTISGFTAYCNGSTFVSTSTSIADVVVSDNIINNASVHGSCLGFVFTGNIVDGYNSYRYLEFDGDAGMVEHNTFVNGLDIRIEGENCSFSENDLEGCGVRIIGDHNTVSKNDFQGGGAYDWAIFSNARYTQITNNTFENCEYCLDSDGFFEVVADNVAKNCSYGFNLDAPGGSSKLVRNNLSDCSVPISARNRDFDLIKQNHIWASQSIDHSGGIVVQGASEVSVVGNLVEHTIRGILVGGDNCTMSGNKVMRVGQIFVDAATGMSAYFSDGEVKGNTIIDIYDLGMVIAGSRNLVDGNLVQDCERPVSVYSSAMHNTITNNDIINNNLSCYDEQLSNTWDHNLFSDYAGPDDNGDGIGDLPYLMDGGNQDPHPRIYGEPPELGEYNIGILPINFVESPKHAGQMLTYPISYYEDLGEELASYYREVSYGALDLKVQVIRKPDDSLLSLTETSADLETMSPEALLGFILSKVNDKVDFRAYDYDPEGGRGVVVVVMPLYIVKHSDPMMLDESEFFMGAQATFGLFPGLDGTSVDAICCFARGFMGEEKATRSLQHEVAHWLGKVLVTYPDGHRMIDGRWSLPDEYTMGNIRQYQSLMGKLVLRSDDQVHLDTWCKIWLRWLEREWMVTERSYDLKTFSKLQLHDKVPSYDYEKTGAGGRYMAGNYIFEARSRSLESGEWDRDTQPFEAINVYQMDTTSLYNLRINLVAQLQASGHAVIVPDLGVALQAISVFGANGSAVRVVNYTLKDMTGATLLPNGDVFKRIQDNLPFADLAPSMWPDSDLHAYAEDGSHVGINYDTGEFEVQIPGAIFSGDLMEGREWIYVPSSNNPRFQVSSADTWRFLEENPSAYQYTDGMDTVLLQAGRWGGDGRLYTSDIELRQLEAGDEYEVPYEMIRNEDGSYSVEVTDQGVFQVIFQCTGLPPSTEWKVVVDGVEYSTFISFMESALAEGEHSFTVPSAQGYRPVPSSGTFSVSGPGTNLSIEFVKEQGSIDLTSFDTTTLMMVGGALAVVLVIALALVARSRRRRRGPG